MKVAKVGLVLSATFSGAGVLSWFLTSVLSVNSRVLSIYIDVLDLVYVSSAGQSVRAIPVLFLLPALMAISAIASLLALRKTYTFLLMTSTVASTATLMVLIDVIYIVETIVLGKASALVISVSHGLLYLFVNYRFIPGPILIFATLATVTSWFNYLYYEEETKIMTLRECLESEARRRFKVSLEELETSRPDVAKAMEECARLGVLCGSAVIEKD